MGRTLAMGWAATLVVAGCSGGSSFNSGAPDDRRVDELSDEELQDACERLDTFVRQDVLPPERTQLAVCTATGIAAENNAAGVTCEETVKDCTSEPPDPTGETVDCSAVTADTVSTCESTVGELERCVNDIASQVDEAMSDLKCPLADEPDWKERLEEIGQQLRSPSCMALDDDCPFADFGTEVEG